MTDLKLVALGFALCAWCEFAQAQVQSRTETIESARTEKEANLKPEIPPKAEMHRTRRLFGDSRGAAFAAG